MGEILQKETLFASLPLAEQARFMQAAIRRTYGEGQVFVTRGEVWPYLFLVDSGEIHAEKQSIEGRRLQVLSVMPGDVFWGLAFFYDDAPMPVSPAGHHRE